MTPLLVSELKNKLNLEYVHKADDRKICDCYIGDMLSVVMSKASKGAVWLTIQTNINIVAVSVLSDLACIVLIEGMNPDTDTILKAKEQNVNVLKTEKSAYELAVEIGKLLNK